MTAIYDDAMTKFFNAQRTTDEFGNSRLVSGDDTPVPTIDQYRHQLKKAIGQQQIQICRWGSARHRRAKAGHEGKFSSSVSNLLERVEGDAYNCEDKPRSLQNGEHLKPLVVTRFVDVASALRIGIGFSLGKENSESYNAALFCAAISKKKFCSLFGIEIEESEWPSQGLSPHSITDRGPGIKREPGHKEHRGKGLVIREITPSGMGQSKGLVESAQRRRTKLEGPAQHTGSKLSVVQMAIREIRSLLAENDSADASGHMTSEMFANDVKHTPLRIWRFLDSRGRNDSESISFDEAVRRFLVKTSVSVHRDGVWLRAQRYSSGALRDTNLLERAATHGRQTITAYIYPVCTRHIWIEVDNQLIEVDAQLNLREDESLLYRSLDELEQEEKQRNQSEAELRLHRRAVKVDQQIKFKKENGCDWNTGTTTRARLKSSRATKEEEKELQAIFKGKGYDDE